MLKPSYNVVFPLFAFLEGENLLNFWHPLKYNLQVTQSRIAYLDKRDTKYQKLLNSLHRRDY